MAKTELWNRDILTMPGKKALIKNSAAVKVGGFVYLNLVAMSPVGAVATAIKGFVKNIVDANGVPMDAITRATVSGTWVSSTGTYTAASDNVTVDGVQVEYVEIEEDTEFKVTLTAAKGTTTGSDKVNTYLAISTSDHSLVDEATASTSTTTDKQFQIVKATGEGLSTTQVVVRCINRQV